ncbi:MAG: hypothetical protein IT380_30115, partial [Myxococcales bacterium]|nr:hypothetical protein [Myxococcales bacterium]
AALYREVRTMREGKQLEPKRLQELLETSKRFGDEPLLREELECAPDADSAQGREGGDYVASMVFTLNAGCAAISRKPGGTSMSMSTAASVPFSS